MCSEGGGGGEGVKREAKVEGGGKRGSRSVWGELKPVQRQSDSLRHYTLSVGPLFRAIGPSGSD